MKKFNIILTENQQKHQHYHLEKIYKYEYLTGGEILPCNQRQITEQPMVVYSPLGKAFEKQAKMIEGQGEKQISN